MSAGVSARTGRPGARSSSSPWHWYSKGPPAGRRAWPLHPPHRRRRGHEPRVRVPRDRRADEHESSHDARNLGAVMPGGILGPNA